MNEDKNPLTQQTLVLAKPDAVKRGLVGEIICRLERVGLKLAAIKLVVPDEQFAQQHYPVTDEWLKKVGSNTLTDCDKYGFDVKELLGTDDPVEIGSMIHRWNVEFFTNQEIVAMVWEGVHAVEEARKLAGTTIPLLAAPGTIRGDFSGTSAISENGFKRTIRNLVHTSGDVEEAKREIKLWFGEV